MGDGEPAGPAEVVAGEAAIADPGAAAPPVEQNALAILTQMVAKGLKDNRRKQVGSDYIFSLVNHPDLTLQLLRDKVVIHASTSAGPAGDDGGLGLPFESEDTRSLYDGDLVADRRSPLFFQGLRL